MICGLEAIGFEENGQSTRKLEAKIVKTWNGEQLISCMVLLTSTRCGISDVSWLENRL